MKKNMTEGPIHLCSTKQEWIVPINLKSAANMREHWAAKRKRNKAQEMAILAAFFKDPVRIYPPCKITLTRVASRDDALDYDNLCYAFKHILDSIGSHLMPGKARGHADGGKYFTVDYAQEKGQYAIKIKIEAL